MQLYLLIPLYAVIFMRSRKAAYISHGLIIVLDSALVWAIIDANNLKAGPLGIESYYMQAYLTNKPYTHLNEHSIGVLFACMYYDLLKYRKLGTEEEKANSYPKLHFWVTRKWISTIGNFFSLGLICLTLTAAQPAIKEPYLWSQVTNDVFLTFNKIGFLLGVFFLFWTMILGHFNWGLSIVKNPYMRTFGKQTFLCAIASPIVITYMYLG